MVDEDFCKNLLDNLHEGIFFTDAKREITYWSRGAEQISGRRSEEVIGFKCYDNIFRHVDEKGSQLCNGDAICPLVDTMKDGAPRQISVYMLHKDGHRVPVQVTTLPIFDLNNRVTGGAEIFSDSSINVRMQARIRGLEKQALLDELTGVGNRRYANAMLYTKLDELKRNDWTFGVIFSDIDNFKSVNDKYGHAVGDKVLKMVAKTISRNVRTMDSVFRWGGEEFLILVANVDKGRLYDTAERIRILVQSSLLALNSDLLNVTISSGITIAGKRDSPAKLMKRTDSLLYKSKSSGKNRSTID